MAYTQKKDYTKLRELCKFHFQNSVLKNSLEPVIQPSPMRTFWNILFLDLCNYPGLELVCNTTKFHCLEKFLEPCEEA